MKNQMFKTVCLALAIVMGGLMAQAFPTSQFASTSKLASGHWVKVSIPTTGIYELTYAELREMGFSNPENVRVYGHGGNVMSEILDGSAIDDLQRVPVRRVHDKICFYGLGPVSFSLVRNNNADYFTRTLNTYSTAGYYFLVDEGGAEFEVLEGENNADANVDRDNSVDYYYHELDRVSPSLSGKVMLGESLLAAPYTVTLTTGIINYLDDAELEGVIAHELTHIRNRDTKVLIISIVFVGILSTLLTLLTRGVLRMFLWGNIGSSRRSNNKGNGGVIVVIIVAIICAAIQLRKEGLDPHPEIMVPLVGKHTEFEQQEEIIRRTAAELFKQEGVEPIDFKVGTMIEIPRAALTADAVAARAEYFSFGTNDLTQMTFGYSRDDIASFLPVYLEKKILKVDPFQVLDQKGVGQLIKMAVDKGRSVRHSLKCGICGEHGGEPSSVKFCHRAGLNYVSCSPFRVPIARLAAAQAAVED